MPRGQRLMPYPSDHAPIPGRPPDLAADVSDLAIAPDGTPMHRGMLGWVPERIYRRPVTSKLVKAAVEETRPLAETLRPFERCQLAAAFLQAKM